MQIDQEESCDRDIFPKAKELVESQGLNYREQYEIYMGNHYVVKTPSSMIWAKRINHPVKAWFIFLAIGSNCFKIWYKQMPYYLPNVAYYRPLRGRDRLHIIPMKRLEKFICSKK